MCVGVPTRDGSVLPGADGPAAPFRAKADFDAGGFGGDKPGCAVGACDGVNGAGTNADGVAHADEDAAYYTDTSDDELEEGRSALGDADSQRIEVEFEEDARRADAVVELAVVVRDAVLVCSDDVGGAGAVCGRYDMQEVLVRNEGLMEELIGIVERLGDIWEIWTERELGDNMRQIHLVMRHMDTTGVPMAERRNVQVGGDLLELQLADDSAGCCVWNVLVLGHLWFFAWSTEDGVEESARSARLLDSLVSGYGVGLLL